MINVVLKGHFYEHDIYELIRVYFPDETIVFSDARFGIFIESILDKENERVVTRLYNRGTLLENTINFDEYRLVFSIKNPEIKFLKASLYRILTDFTGKVQQWGMLTGIRPVKIAHTFLENRIDDCMAEKLLTDFYGISLKNAKAMMDIAKRQNSIIKKYSEKNFSIYINIPFCPTKCSYCSFPTVIAEKYKDKIGAYVDKLVEEIEDVKIMMEGKKLATVYIGGGTPSAIDTCYLEKIIKAVNENFPEEIDEFTVECGRPETINSDLIKMLSENGIDRISINPQTMNDNTLKVINRDHTTDEIKKAYTLAKNSAIKHINMDLILGLPTEKTQDLEKTLDEINKMAPDNLTIHTLAFKKSSKLTKMGKKTDSDSIIEDMLEISKDFAKKNGYHPYYLYRQKNMLGNLENIGYCKDGTDCIYNILSMEEVQTIIGVGMGAISKFYFKDTDRIERVANFKSLEEYMNRFLELKIRKQKALG